MRRGTAYERSDHWLALLGDAAERIVSELAPARVLDVGCAHGFLVEVLRDRGVDASGFDISDYAISQAGPDLAPHLRVGNVLEPIPGRYDLVTCIGVLEHLDEGDAPAAVANICAVTDYVIFSATRATLAMPPGSTSARRSIGPSSSPATTSSATPASTDRSSAGGRCGTAAVAIRGHG